MELTSKTLYEFLSKHRGLEQAISLKDLASCFNTSKARIARKIKKLRGQGVMIGNVRGLGFYLVVSIGDFERWQSDYLDHRLKAVENFLKQKERYSKQLELLENEGVKND